MTELNNFHYTGLKELELLESSLLNYNYFIVNSFINHLGASGGRILDYGAGVGTLSVIFNKLNLASRIVCLELDRSQLAILESRGFSTITCLNAEMIFDYIYTSNVLEHIEDDNNALAKMHTALITNG